MKMKSASKFSFAVLLLVVLATVACGPTYVQPMAYQQQPQYEYNPGYNPNNVVADAIIASAIINGMTQYSYGGRYYPQAMYGGVPGYYVGGVFHTSAANHTTIVNNYNTGRSEFQRNPAQYAQRNPSAVTKPAYTGQSSSGTGQQAAPQAAKPNYGSGGSMGRNAPTSQQQATQAQQKPNYGSGGSMAQAPAASSRPNYGSGGSMNRSSSSSSSSSSTGRSSRK